jgi:phosphopantothenoylcysteine decarboxylase / phosphopantothenate---cysteine ligase
VKLRFVVASGPTREPIDPVRYLSNYSTGVMGSNVVAAAKKRGHRVEWVRCPERAQTALDLEKVLKRLVPKNDVLVMAAAVADVRPAVLASKKIKKEKLSAIRLVKNPDILAGLARKKRKGQVFVGFGLESEKLSENGRSKLEKKGLELIVLQRVTAKDKPFGDKAIDAVLMDASGRAEAHAGVTKRRLAGLLVRRAEAIFASKNRP